MAARPAPARRTSAAARRKAAADGGNAAGGAARPAPAATELELEVGEPAHGGGCVARAPDGRVVFVRHALPGEQVRAVVTRHRSTLLWADAVEVLRPSPDRVVPPCPWAGPGRCGGCDLQHASPEAQLRWKAAVVREQLARLAGLDVPVQVEPLPAVPGAEGPGLGWRTRVGYSIDARGRAGLLGHASHEVVPIDRCRIAHPAVQAAPGPDRAWPGGRSLQVAVGADGAVRTVLRRRRGGTEVTGPAALAERAAGRDFAVRGFWQVHPGAAQALSDAVRDLLDPQPGERALDLYAGAGLFAVTLAVAGCTVLAVESGHHAALDAVRNAAGLGVTVWEGSAEEALAPEQHADLGAVDVAVLDPPRAGAGRPVVDALAALAPRAVAYVACDPAALARDLALFAGHGWQLAGLRAFDCFPMTHHVECVALVVPGGPR